MDKPVLVIMAAGMGSRYGGLKQIDPVDDEGHIIMDFSLYDARKAGFEKVIFIIKRENEADFREAIGDRVEKYMEVSYAFQEIGNIPEGYSVPEGRVKPWGTAHAVLSCIDQVDGPFAVINADDYYGKEAFVKLHDYLSQHKEGPKDRYDLCMAGFVLKNTLSENGGVTRGVCEVDENRNLRKVTETYEIRYKDGVLHALDENGHPVCVQENQQVSMNMWGMQPDFLKELERGFLEFLKGIGKDDMRSEYLLPRIIDRLLQERRAEVKVLETNDKWFGVTYQEDKQSVVDAIRALVDQGVYRADLFGKSR